ncbi:hypothetical protein BOX15_Mlig028072g3 [Macrostomum lignano]|uniref:Tyrosine-protein kinase n=1 Tax=Macrostomum lignano TaxID=282301 RepID=A0A267FRS9_9PLAT|nr:hypothetical protein BOX15_Mlig028072g3 [Macrostomum lignano]
MGQCFARLIGRVPSTPSESRAVSSDIPLEPTPRMKTLFAYTAQTPGDLSFEKDEILYFEREDVEGWCWCRNKDGETGFVPSNFVQRLDLGPESLPCWFDVDRHEAMSNLLMPGYKPGTYLLRPCHQQRVVAKYTLSVRSEVLNENTGEMRPTVSHYMVKAMDNGGYYISPSNRFDGMADLLEYYKEPGRGLAAPLSLPCPKVWVPPAQFRDFEVERERITILEKLGSGSFGEVYKAQLGRRQMVAVKTMTEGAMRKEEFLSEGRTLHKLHHPKIVQLLGVCTKDDPIYIITEFMPNGDLKNYLMKDRDVGKITFEVMVTMLSQIAEGMEYLETKSFVHRDLRAANILVGHNFVVKVADFGLSKFLEEDVYSVAVENKFPVRWTAPEAAQSMENFTIKSDVWSYGVLIYEVVTRGAVPYANIPNKDIITRVSKEKYRMPNPRSLGNENDDHVYKLMLDCWHERPEDRPTFARLKDIFQTYKTQFENQYSQND